ncbi:hypothetical protein C8J56DRAFT_1172827 [Mycena floridula]|nr:hypothetical protein C8J56DRAFT_1172827 [Mycena floridula]
MAGVGPSLIPNRITPISQELFAQTYGWSLVCVMVMLVLYGTYIYFITYAADHIVLKSLVFLVWIFATVHTVFGTSNRVILHVVTLLTSTAVCIGAYHFDIVTYSQPVLVVTGEWSVLAAISVGVVVCFFVQMQVVIRASRYYTDEDVAFAQGCFMPVISRKKWRIFLTGVLSALILAQVGLGIFLSVKLFQLWDPEKIVGATYIAMIPLFAVRVVSDSFTSISLCIILYDSQPIFSRSAKLLRTLIMYAMNRFVMTTIVVIAQTVILIIEPGSIWAMSMDIVNVQIYVNSFLSILNSRNHLREIGSGNQMSSIPIALSAVRFKPASQGANSILSANREAEFDREFNRTPAKTIHESYSMSKIDSIGQAV